MSVNTFVNILKAAPPDGQSAATGYIFLAG